MLNKYPLWKYILILAIMTLGVIYALPNLYPPDPAVQLTPSKSGDAVDDFILKKALSSLDDAGIAYFGEELKSPSALIRIKELDQQLAAKTAIKRALGDEFVVALNMAQTTPQWLLDLGAGPMTLGLDLSGGVHFLMEVDMDAFIEQKLDNYKDDIKRQLRDAKLRYTRVVLEKDKRIQIVFADEKTRDDAEGFVRRQYDGFLTATDKTADEQFVLWLSLNDIKIKEYEDYAIKQNLTTLRNRVNELGVAEPLVQRQGRNRIVVELPGVQDTAAAKKILGKAANLEFRLEASPDESRFNTEEFSFRDNNRAAGRSARIEKSIIVTGDNVSNAQPSFDENGQPQVNISLDAMGGDKMGKVTRKSVGRRMAVLFVEHKAKTRYEMVDGVETAVTDKIVEKNIISLATIQSTLGSSFRITYAAIAAAST